ncbi:MAG: class I SAM-dependent methyltransferase [Candidatus Omnitrophica bacterium]|nr:class I SAM-dependent methyltransferase [Candidatus Omnitrophota bacterium]
MRAPFIYIAVLIAFLVNTLSPLPTAWAQEYHLPDPGIIVHLSPPLDPPMLKGIKVYPDNPFRFDFILDRGDSELTNDQLKYESGKLVKYFLASLTTPEKDLWVNLSPYEKDRIIPQSFGLTEMGRDLLAEDYMLKQITASLIYPEDVVGKQFWEKIYEEAAKKYGTTDIPINTFNKVWIIPEKAVVYENTKVKSAYVVEAKLKVMLEQDYLALSKNQMPSPLPNDAGLNLKTPQVNNGRPSDISALGSQIVREVVIPELTREVNENKNFAKLRQVYSSLILATWYKTKIKDSILSQVYADQNKVAGINIDDPNERQKIYDRYLRAFKKGVFNYIKEETDTLSQETIPRKYFSGGEDCTKLGLTMTYLSDQAMESAVLVKNPLEVSVNISPYSKSFMFRQAQARAQARANENTEPVFSDTQEDIQAQNKPGEWWRGLKEDISKTGSSLIKFEIMERKRRIDALWNRARFNHLEAAFQESVIRQVNADTDFPKTEEEKKHVIAYRLTEPNREINRVAEALMKNEQIKASELKEYIDMLAEMFDFHNAFSLVEIILSAPSLPALRKVYEAYNNGGKSLTAFYYTPVVSGILLKARTEQEFDDAVGLFIKTFSGKGIISSEITNQLRLLLGRSTYPQYAVPDLGYFRVILQVISEIWARDQKFPKALLHNVSRLVQDKASLESFENTLRQLSQYRHVPEDPSGAVVGHVGNMWPMKWEQLNQGIGIGLGGFVYKALTTPATPAGIHEIMADARDVTNTTMQRMEQNRKDAFVFNKLGFGGRDFIHDQSPGVHQILEAWIGYYQSGGKLLVPRPTDIASYAVWPPTEENLKDPQSVYFGKDVIALLNSEMTVSGSTMKAIQFIERLEKNTSPVLDKPPGVYDTSSGVGYENLDRELQELHKRSSLEKTDTFSLGLALNEANQILRQMQKDHQVGVMPNFVLSLGWLEAKAVAALQEARQRSDADYYLDQLYRETWFKEVVEFMRRIHSPTEAVNDFDASELQSEKSDDVYRKLGWEALTFVREWVRIHEKNGRKHFNDQLWTFNLVDAFIMLGAREGVLPASNTVERLRRRIIEGYQGRAVDADFAMTGINKLMPMVLYVSSGSKSAEGQNAAVGKAVSDFITADNKEALRKAVSLRLNREVALSDIKQIGVGLNPLINEKHYMRLVQFAEAEIVIRVKLMTGETVDFLLKTVLKSIRDEQAAISTEDRSDPNLTAPRAYINGKNYVFVSNAFRLGDGAIVRYGLVEGRDELDRVIVKGYHAGLYMQAQEFGGKVQRARAKLMTRVLWQPLMESLGDDDRVLNVAVGEGRDLFTYDETRNEAVPLPDAFFGHMVATDFMAEPLRALKQRYPALETIPADWRNIPLPSGSVRTVVGLNAISYVPLVQLDAVIKEWDRLLKVDENGQKSMIFMTDIIPNRNRFYENSEQSKNPESAKLSALERNLSFAKEWQGIIRQFFERNGYEVSFETVSEEVVAKATGLHGNVHNYFEFGLGVGISDQDNNINPNFNMPLGSVREKTNMILVRATKNTEGTAKPVGQNQSAYTGMIERGHDALIENREQVEKMSVLEYATWLSVRKNAIKVFGRPINEISATDIYIELVKRPEFRGFDGQPTPEGIKKFIKHRQSLLKLLGYNAGDFEDKYKDENWMGRSFGYEGQKQSDGARLKGYISFKNLGDFTPEKLLKFIDRLTDLYNGKQLIGDFKIAAPHRELAYASIVRREDITFYGATQNDIDVALGIAQEVFGKEKVVTSTGVDLKNSYSDIIAIAVKRSLEEEKTFGVEDLPPELLTHERKEFLRFGSARPVERQLADRNTKADTGGIDLTPANMALQIQNNRGEIKFHLDPVMLLQLQNAPGFVPVIINIQPVSDLKVFLGLAENKSGSQTANL